MTLHEWVKQHLESISHFRGRIGLFTFEFDARARALTMHGIVPSYYLKQAMQNALSVGDMLPLEFQRRFCERQSEL